MNKLFSFLGTVITTLIVAGILTFIVWGLYKASQPEPAFFQGQMEAHEVDIAPKISARISQVHVKEGDQIQLDDIIVEMHSPEIEAKYSQAQAMLLAAQAEKEKANSGIMPQEISIAKLTHQQALTAAALAETTYRRLENLYKEGLVSEQKRDDARAAAKAAHDAARAAKAAQELALALPRSEDRTAADAMAQQAAGGVAEVEAFREDTRLRSPVSGEVTNVYAKVGELSPQGVPVITVVDLNDQWVVLNVREDSLNRFNKGKSFKASIPALENLVADFTVYYVGVLPDFATWRATRQYQGFDVRTFQIRARPPAPIKGVRPGMSVIVMDTPK